MEILREYGPKFLAQSEYKKFADDMQDLSNATGVAVNSIVGLGKVFQQNAQYVKL